MSLDTLKPIAYAITSLASQSHSIPVMHPNQDSDTIDSIVKFRYEDYYSAPVEFDRTTDFEEHIKSFRLLSKNWDGYGAVIPGKNVINNSVRFIKSLPDNLLSNLDTESIVPTPYGSIVLDFQNNDDLISIEIGENKIGFFTDFKNSENLSSDGIFFNQEIFPKELSKAFQKLYQ